MLQIEKAVLSLDILERKFACNVKKCKGACCIHGDSGAPLEDEEAALLTKIYPDLRSFLRQEGIEAIEKQGAFVIDDDGDKVTPLVNGGECAYVVFDGLVAKCGIEKAYENKAVNFKKPISCHLYPIRVTKYSTFEALNYHEWNICRPAVATGKEQDVSLFVFLADPLIRKFGKEWYDQLLIASKELKRQAAGKHSTGE